MTGLNDFSIFAAENGTGAAPILWAEGMPAKGVNDSAREMMAALARWRTDNCGVLGAPLTGNAASLTTFQTIKESHFAAGFSVSFATTQTNTGPMTLDIDGTGAKPWRRPRGIEFGPGDIVPLQIHTVVWSPPQGAYVSLSPTFDEPGKIEFFAAVEAIPSGWVECDGREVSRSAYTALLSRIGFAHGAGNGSTTFNVPDMNGRVPFGRDSGKGRLTGAGGLGGNIGNVGGSETVTLSVAQMPSHSHSGSTAAAGGQAATNTGAAGGHNHGGSTGNGGAHNHTGSTGGAGGHSHGGTTDAAGNHVHNQNYERLSIYGGGGALSAVSQLYPPGNNSAATGEAGGVHQHNVTTDAVGDHAHPFTTNGVADHAHGIPGAPDHTHTVPAIPDHSHGLTVNATGDGGAHTNMPPGLVGVFAIKA
ncbi:phage tail protein [Methylorubrum populi]|uniref:Phage tail collar domain-containing protein n=1 Tax=Methylorubrum populi TaxID=223967 RepID=A0A833J090_9HYPH|nr:tail fiber protein [Methylorubrum populi]KAB7782178.1 hypothetical protein F8B43_4933 [Methylorubrum populi]